MIRKFGSGDYKKLVAQMRNELRNELLRDMRRKPQILDFLQFFLGTEIDPSRRFSPN